ncbi:MAG TPA: helix-turn-helix domain-containing GNAT family N-acetyltransferase [Stackebrandtia sp.]|uniref:bifunctional helix-turn-helix transcriptional regulator/GNAT family N-acetyltransferase n=1 Tax=Stackebrandtia sp. TaxID=2023065 RepID=UPI002D5C1490|nr:helix-turn-helix domain-containing GNAT family N-acetyltransferase [Stackebrandtia sp.]HZE40807.1 helix-turn-helix domain-containing GNAT family N-acetyltransferase [Stackebrandtia sp.]
MSRVSDAHIDRVRAFNRFFTKLIGVLNEGLLDSPYSLTEVRVLFELRARGRIEGPELRRDLGMDAGYFSRVLTRFSDAGLVSRTTAPADLRRYDLSLTDSGRDVFDALDAKSTEQIRTLLAGISHRDTTDVVAAMATIRAILDTTPPAGEVIIRAPRPGDLGWMIQRNGAVYAAEHDWDDQYEALVARIVADYAANHDPQREACWIAELDGRAVGAVMCVQGPDADTAKLRVLLVEPSARGRGIGARLVDECLDFARKAGYRRITLWTMSVLEPARRVYQRAGFVLESEEDTRSFGHDLTAQVWSRPL